MYDLVSRCCHSIDEPNPGAEKEEMIARIGQDFRLSKLNTDTCCSEESWVGLKEERWGRCDHLTLASRREEHLIQREPVAERARKYHDCFLSRSPEV